MEIYKHLQICAYLVITVCIFDLANARGGRGGGGARGGARSSGRRSGSSRSGSRSGGIRTSRSFSSFSAYKIALLAGTIHGARRYMSRRRYYDNRDEEPTICTNNNMKDENGTSYGKFICPMYNQEDDHDWCCGSSTEEYCCTYWDDDGRLAGAVIGIVIGVLVTILIIGCIAVKCCNVSRPKFTTFKRQQPTAPAQQMAYTSAADNTTYTTMSTNPPPPYSTDDQKYGVPADNTNMPSQTQTQYGFAPAVVNPPAYGVQ